MELGFKRGITKDDLYKVLPEDDSETLGRKLEMLVDVLLNRYFCNCVTIFFLLQTNNQGMGKRAIKPRINQESECEPSEFDCPSFWN